MVVFDTGVNVSVGLPIDRTSVNHGIAFDIAGKGIAKPYLRLFVAHRRALLEERAVTGLRSLAPRARRTALARPTALR